MSEFVEQYLREQGERVSNYLSSIFPEPTRPRVLFDSMNYSLLAGGKRLRPILCIATAQTFDVAPETVLPAAASLEFIHTYSLIHDDLPCMDNDDLRRGKPTNHRVFGEATALLAGDALLTYAFQLLSMPMRVPPERQLQMIRTLATAAGCLGMVGGQMADMEAETKGGSLPDLEFIHANKTAKLIEASVEMGTWFVDISEPKREALRLYGKSLGLAFQVVDDILDEVGDTEILGKMVGMDKKLQKLTYPSLIGLDASREVANDLVTKGLDALTQAEINAPLLEEIAAFIVQRNQ